jgi:hypothetical protein
MFDYGAFKFQDHDLEKSVHTAIGEFVVNFELMTAGMKFILKAILKDDGLNTIKYFDILTHDATAKPLLDYLKAFVWENKKGVHDFIGREKFKNLCNEIEQCFALRNDVLHAHWYVTISGGDLVIRDGDLVIEDGDFASEPLELGLKAKKQKVKKEGLSDAFEKNDNDLLEKLKQDAKKFKTITGNLNFLHLQISEYLLHTPQQTE